MMALVEELKARRGLIDAEEMAELLGMNQEVLYRKAKTRLVPHFRIMPGCGSIRFGSRSGSMHVKYGV
jgi:predicted DNA-binding transcriptional regulator AlpA